MSNFASICNFKIYSGIYCIIFICSSSLHTHFPGAFPPGFPWGRHLIRQVPQREPYSGTYDLLDPLKTTHFHSLSFPPSQTSSFPLCEGVWGSKAVYPSDWKRAPRIGNKKPLFRTQASNSEKGNTTGSEVNHVYTPEGGRAFFLEYRFTV